MWLKWAVLFSPCGRVCLIPSLLSNHVSIKVKSCFFLWSKSLARHIQLLRAGENSKTGNVLATEMRWKPPNMLSQSEIQDKSLVPNLPPPLTSASDLMAQPVFPFKMSHQGTVNTSISQWVLGSTPADALSGKCSSTKGHFKCYLLCNKFCALFQQAHQAFLLMFKKSTLGKKGWVILNLRWLLSNAVYGFAVNPASRQGMMREIWAITVIFHSGSRQESNYKGLVNEAAAGRESGKALALGFSVSRSLRGV